ncbi:hypothetical protein JI739_10845 [Ramlibacter sp. AW1]|uniref:Uncharacterized protein n=1 Tax=Ramlibacter aurantiacus TaxID=2801330 RepID=A0A936ZJ84_9BURK|nr:hypothetical protein [Ramlibacter aurantiacus]MBL0420842.1 hypothetical protein [Ramlibacter aurantiacus]
MREGVAALWKKTASQPAKSPETRAGELARGVWQLAQGIKGTPTEKAKLREILISELIPGYAQVSSAHDPSGMLALTRKFVEVAAESQGEDGAAIQAFTQALMPVFSGPPAAGKPRGSGHPAARGAVPSQDVAPRGKSIASFFRLGSSKLPADLQGVAHDESKPRAALRQAISNKDGLKVALDGLAGKTGDHFYSLALFACAEITGGGLKSDRLEEFANALAKSRISEIQKEHLVSAMAHVLAAQVDGDPTTSISGLGKKLTSAGLGHLEHAATSATKLPLSKQVQRQAEYDITAARWRQELLFPNKKTIAQAVAKVLAQAPAAEHPIAWAAFAQCIRDHAGEDSAPLISRLFNAVMDKYEATYGGDAIAFGSVGKLVNGLLSLSEADVVDRCARAGESLTQLLGSPAQDRIASEVAALRRDTADVGDFTAEVAGALTRLAKPIAYDDISAQVLKARHERVGSPEGWAIQLAALTKQVASDGPSVDKIRSMVLGTPTNDRARLFAAFDILAEGGNPTHFVRELLRDAAAQGSDQHGFSRLHTAGDKLAWLTTILSEMADKKALSGRSRGALSAYLGTLNLDPAMLRQCRATIATYPAAPNSR